MRHPIRFASLSAVCLAALSWSSATPDQDPASAPEGQDPPSVAEAFRAEGIHLDTDAGLAAIPVSVEITGDLLEYLLVARHGQAHETLFLTQADPTVLNAALVALGVEPGQNAAYVPKDPAPSEEELRDGAKAYTVEPPQGDGFYLYCGWREGEETYWFRVEDLIRDLDRLRTMRRHRWVYLGSKMVQRVEDGPQRFAAAVEGNLINIAFFTAGSTLLTGSLPECDMQTIWLANAWLLPPRGSEVLMVFARDRIAVPEGELAERLPLVEAPPAADERR